MDYSFEKASKEVPECDKYEAGEGTIIAVDKIAHFFFILFIEDKVEADPDQKDQKED